MRRPRPAAPRPQPAAPRARAADARPQPATPHARASEDVPLWRVPAMRRLVVVSVLGFSSFCLTLASLPSWAHAGGVGAGAAGLVTTVMLATTVLAQAAVPAVVGRLGMGPVLAAGLVLLGLPAPLLGASHHLGLLLAVSAVRGLGFAVLTVVGATLTATVAAPGRHGEAVGLYGLAIAVPNLVAVPAGVALTQAGAFGWVALLAAAPVLAVPAALSFGHGAPAALPAAPAPAEGLSDDAGSAAGQSAQQSAALPTHRAAALAALSPSLILLVVTLAGGGLVTFLPIGRPTGILASVALVLFGAFGALTRWRAGLLADRIGSRLLLPASLVAATAGLVTVAVGLAMGAGSAGGSGVDPGSGVGSGSGVASAVVILVGAAVFGTGYGAVQNLTLVIAFAQAGPGRTATASAMWNAAFDAGTGVGAVAVGAVAATGLGLPWAFGLSAALIAAGLPVALLRARRPGRSAQQPVQHVGGQV